MHRPSEAPRKQPIRGGCDVALKQLELMRIDAEREAKATESGRSGSIQAAFLRGKAEAVAEASAVIREQFGSGA